MAKFLTNVARRGFLKTASGAAVGASASQVGSLRAAVEKEIFSEVRRSREQLPAGETTAENQ